MKFCNICENMYYIKIDDDDSNLLNYYCRNCGNTDKNYTKENIIINKTNIKESNKELNYIINEYTVLDPTLPRTNKIDCINIECPTNKNNITNKEIIYIRYDEINIKYIYLCSTCHTNWKSN
jgi:DNA-directed RNA polymerase subunit M/transcription elongation factor TFIIS